MLCSDRFRLSQSDSLQAALDSLCTSLDRVGLSGGRGSHNRTQAKGNCLNSGQGTIAYRANRTWAARPLKTTRRVHRLGRAATFSRRTTPLPGAVPDLAGCSRARVPSRRQRNSRRTGKWRLRQKRGHLCPVSLRYRSERLVCHREYLVGDADRHRGGGATSGGYPCAGVLAVGCGRFQQRLFNRTDPLCPNCKLI